MSTTYTSTALAHPMEARFVGEQIGDPVRLGQVKEGRSHIERREYDVDATTPARPAVSTCLLIVFFPHRRYTVESTVPARRLG